MKQPTSDLLLFYAPIDVNLLFFIRILICQDFLYRKSCIFVQAGCSLVFTLLNYFLIDSLYYFQETGFISFCVSVIFLFKS